MSQLSAEIKAAQDKRDMLIRAWIAEGKTPQDIAKLLDITTQRAYKLVKRLSGRATPSNIG